MVEGIAAPELRYLAQYKGVIEKCRNIVLLLDHIHSLALFNIEYFGMQGITYLEMTLWK